MKFIILLQYIILFFSQHVFSFEKIEISNEIRIVNWDGYEFHIKGPGSKVKDQFGVSVQPNSRTEITKFKNGKKILSYVTTIDKNGFRTSLSSHKANKKNHLILIDGSFVFGENLNDDETIAHKINSRSQNYEAYALADLGHGPNQAWLHFAMNELNKKIIQKTGSALIFVHDADIQRFFGQVNHLFYIADSPRVIETVFGEFKISGSFLEAGTPIQKILINYCVPLSFCRIFLNSINISPSDSDYLAINRLFLDIEKKYKKKFDAVNLKIIWHGSFKSFLKFKKFSQIEVIFMPEIQSSADGHPTNEGANQITNFLISKKIIN